jgi:hypothetical protein
MFVSTCPPGGGGPPPQDGRKIRQRADRRNNGRRILRGEEVDIIHSNP